jgi:hypothetical protein
LFAGLAAGAVVLLLIGLLWFAAPGKFVLNTLDYIVESIARYWTGSVALVRGVVIIASIPFFWAVAKYTHRIFLVRLRPSLGIYTNRYGVIIVSYVGVFFIVLSFAQQNKYFWDYCADTKQGISVSDSAGVEPVFGVPYHRCTSEEIISLTHSEPVDVCIGDPHRTEFFDSVTGRPRVWYCVLADGTYRFFDREGKCPVNGEDTRAIDRNLVQEIFEQRIKLAECRKQPGSPPVSVTKVQGGSGSPSGNEPPGEVPLPNSLPKPKPHIVDAGIPIRIGDFSFVMNECRKFQTDAPSPRLNCLGVIENTSDRKLQVNFTQGSVIDDKGTQYAVAGGPYYLGLPAILVFGVANSSQELLPQMPVKFGFQMIRWGADSTAFNYILKFTTAGDPSESEVAFRNIPIRE